MLLRWKPGFHLTFLPNPILHHPEMYLLHLPEVDKEMCTQVRYGVDAEMTPAMSTTLTHPVTVCTPRAGHRLCLVGQREYKKFLAMQIAHDHETKAGFNYHLASGSSMGCKSARLVYMKERNAVYDAGGTKKVEQMPEMFRAVDL